MPHSDSRAFCTSVSPQRCWRHFGTDRCGGIRLRSWMRGALLEPGTAPPVRYFRLLIRYLGCNRVGLHFSSAWLASAFDLVLRRYWHSGADFPSYNVVEAQSPECSRPV